jgi:hypothetical protein
MSSTSGVDPNVPLPPVDEDSDLVGQNNKRGVSDDDPRASERKASGVTLPMPGAGAYPVTATYADQVEEAAGDDEDTRG